MDFAVSGYKTILFCSQGSCLRRMYLLHGASDLCGIYIKLFISLVIALQFTLWLFGHLMKNNYHLNAVDIMRCQEQKVKKA